MVITEQLLYTYHTINDDNVVIEVLTDTDLSKLQKLVLDLQKQTGYQYLYCGRKYHAIHWQQTDPEAAKFLLQYRDAERKYVL